MDQAHLWASWLRYKQTPHHFFKLREPCSAEFEFKRVTGPRSIYAYVHFRCEPAEALSFTSAAQWPEQLTPTYYKLLEEAIGYGIVESLIADPITPYSGCALTLTEVRFDDIGSSEVAFHLATKEAMKSLLTNGGWELLPCAVG